MKFILTPSLDSKDAEIASEKIEAQSIDISLGGFFYDYLLNQSGQVVGVRYWGMPDSQVSKGPLDSFINDPRFLFSKNENFVDIVFYSREIPALRDGKLEIDCVQNFGGDSVLNLNGQFAILFDLPIE
jgi:hypothetical protein